MIHLAKVVSVHRVRLVACPRKRGIGRTTSFAVRVSRIGVGQHVQVATWIPEDRRILDLFHSLNRSCLRLTVRPPPVSAHSRPETRADRGPTLTTPYYQRSAVLEVVRCGTPGLFCRRAILEVRDIDPCFPRPWALWGLSSVNPQILREF
eukprot:COSAG02_NODE_23717_length_710_cov_0.929624_2_plen_149_part_01